MIVGFDGKPLLMQKTGIGKYTDRLLASLLALDQEFSCRVHLPFSLEQRGAVAKGQATALRKQYPSRVDFVSSHFPPKLRRWIWRSSNFMPMERIVGEIDLFHATNLVMPPLRRAKGVFTVYDLTFMLFPEYHVKGMHSFARDTKKYVDRSDCLIAISEHTKRDVVEHLHIPPERVRVTLLAADERYRVISNEQAVAAVLAKYGIDREYILYTGTLEPRKNVPTLLRAFHLFRQETGAPHRLVLAGKRGWLYDKIFAEVRSLGLEADVIFTGYVPDEDLPYLYNGAALFAYPSFYEGFGLPPLEAMACGCPVVTSNRSSLPEVVGDAGLMVDPNRHEELAEAMVNILSNGQLSSLLREKGLSRAAEFSWKRCAVETLAIYNDVLGKGPIL